MRADLDYIAHLARESARFGAAIGEAAPDEPVPSCPDWTADDLLWHLGSVQWWWGVIVRDHLTGPQADSLKPERPAGRAALQAFYQRASRDLGQILAAAAPDAPTWTWSDDQTVGFVRRRQAHEALIHRIDAELAAGSRTPADPLLAADGVDEGLRVMYGGVPEWGRFTPDEAKTIRIEATDTGDTWLITLGRFTGTDPDGTRYDEPDIHAAGRAAGRAAGSAAGSDPGGHARALISASAADLDCWLWHRPPLGQIDCSGDKEVLSGFEAVIGPGIN